VEILKRVKSPADLKSLTIEELHQLTGEVRDMIIESVSQTGGHLASSLGTVELTVALHKVFDSPKDKIIWDVGHQAYAHKILTGRADRFSTLRQYGGLSGFLRRSESPHDVFGAGHSSTSISAAMGFAKARDVLKEDHKVVAVIGDGSLTAGMSFEALNDAGQQGRDILIILNDNKMSISPNVGALSSYLNRIITGEFYNSWKRRIEETIHSIPRYGKRIRSLMNRFEEGLKGIIIPGILFEEMGLRYFGPIDGHNLENLIEVLENSKNLKMPKIIHVITTKGKGYDLAEKDPLKWHGASKFDKVTGKTPAKPSSQPSAPTYTQVFSQAICELATEDKRIVAITAAMCTGTGLEEFSRRFPDRFYDIGIAEQHGVTMAAGLALGGLKPVVTIYSTFLQRAYDQILHDVCLQDIPVIFAMDRAGLVGADGATHQGLFDIAYLRTIPNIILMAPSNELELHQMFRTALIQNHPCAIRYPRGEAGGLPQGQERFMTLEIGKAQVLQQGHEVAIVVYGTIMADLLKALPLLEQEGIHPTVVNARFAKPIDREMIITLAQDGYKIITVEEHQLAGGFGSRVLEVLEEEQLPLDHVLRLGVPDHFVEHGERPQILEDLGLSPAKMARRIIEFCGKSHHSTTLAAHNR